VKHVIKKKPFGGTLREQLDASARDRLYSFILDYGGIRGALVHATRMVSEMQGNHALGAVETTLLGHAYVAAALMTASLKGADRVQVRVQGSGPAGALSVEANAFGEVRGYLAQVPIEISSPPTDSVHGGLLGDGVLTVTRLLERARRPFAGQVELRYPTLAENLAHYFVVSEQTPTAFNLSVRLDPAGTVQGAAGLFLQVLPGSDERTAERLEALLGELPSLADSFHAHADAHDFLQTHFGPFSPLLLGQRRVAFMCHCGEERFRLFLGALPVDELQDILEKGPFPVVTICHNCNSRYLFSRGEIQTLLARARAESA
jgi:molecular chaperone Hsp33